MSSVAQGFGFNASAVVFGGLVTTPSNEHRPIKSAPSVALAPSGGDAVSEMASAYTREPGIRFHHSYTGVTGSVLEAGKVHQTVVRVGLRDLNIFGLVKAERIDATLTSTHDASGDSSFTILASFKRLEIAGDGITAPLDFELFSKVPTYKEFVDFFLDPGHMETYATKFGWDVDSGRSSTAAMLAAFKAGDPLPSPEPIRCSLVTKPVVAGTDVTELRQQGYSLLLPRGLGTVHLAEVLVKPGRRRLNMLRVELPRPSSAVMRVVRKSGFARLSDDSALTASSETYSATVCSGEGNGSSTFPP
jgi:hypothetical protein